jgi:HK97 family phage major capsid protein
MTEELTDSQFAEKTGELIAEIRTLQGVIKDNEQTEDAKVAAKATRDEQAQTLQVMVEEREQKRDQEIDKLLVRAEARTASKASLMGGKEPLADTGRIGDGRGFFVALAQARSRDAEVQAIGKARLQELGSHWAEPPAGDPSYGGVLDSPPLEGSSGKATLGTTDAAGGYIIPNNIVDDIERVAVADNPYRQLLSIRRGVRTPVVDVPFSGAPARAVVAAWGATKQNVDLAYGNYTVTMYTIARIYDVANQLLRYSAGAAEEDVREALSEGFALGESYYILNGTGTNEPRGLLTSIAAAGAQFSTARSGTANTIAGSIVKGITTAAGVLAARDQPPDGVVLNASDYWAMVSEGTDNAGFFWTPSQGPSAFDATRGQASVFGVRAFADSNMPTDTAIVGRFKGAKLYLGQGYRVDVSTEAGDRWDKNLTGFRGEEEMGFNADPYVYAGRFQRLTNVIA